MKSITKEQMAKVDQIAFTKYNMNIMHLMENAGRLLAEFTRKLLKDVKRKKIVILVGKGNNGGAGIAAARHLTNWGSKIIVILVNKKIGIASKKQLQLLKKYDTKIIHYTKNKTKEIHKYCKQANLIQDCLIGYNLKGNPKAEFKNLIEIANNYKTKMIACDNPRGLDVTTGNASETCIKAKCTLTLALPKTGLVKNKSKKYVGNLYLCDIGIPHKLYNQIGIKVPTIFNKKSIIKVG